MNLSPAEAVDRINEAVTVEMLVQRTKGCTGSRQVFLDSERDFQDPKNLGVVITRTGAAKFKETGVDDPAVAFKGRIIRVKGTVIIKEKRPRIEVDDPGQIKIVETTNRS